MIYQTENIKITFGNQQNSPFTIDEFKLNIDTQKSLLREKLKLSSINSFFLHQTHSDKGLIINNNYNLMSLEKSGDFLLTNLKNLNMGVLTADCLPIIFYDQINHTAAIAHAGWPGTVKYIAKNVLYLMRKKFNSNMHNIKIFFGPSAKVCCYEVDSVFYQKLNNSFINKTLIKKNDKFFFDIPTYNKLILQKEGIFDFNVDYNLCTICNKEFCSFRRNKEASGLQITTIELL